VVGPLTWVLIGLLVVFSALDAFAHFTKYRYGETFSKWDQDLQRRYRIVRVVNVVLWLALGAHLILGWF
jgi:hypothetical protein